MHHASARRSFLPTLLLLLILALSLSLLAAADSHTRDAPPRRRHHALSRLEPNRTLLSKRYDNAKFTYYHAGNGACGGSNGDNDWVRRKFHSRDAPARAVLRADALSPLPRSSR